MRVLSSEAIGETPTAKLFDEVCTNDDVIPGIERLWPKTSLQAIRDSRYQEAVSKCTITKAKSYAVW